jgi:hypothetical protein
MIIQLRLAAEFDLAPTGHRTPLVGALHDTRTIFLGEAGQDAAAARGGEVKPRPVQSEATVSLITSAVGAISRDKKLGRAEALRRAMLAVIDKDRALLRV